MPGNTRKEAENSGSDSDATKKKIVQTLIEMLGTTPLNKITVGNLCSTAKISRQTFYYHFSDIVNVYRWAVSSKMRYGLTDYSAFIAPDPSDYILDLCYAIKANVFLTNAFYGLYQIELLDSLRDYFFNVCRVSLNCSLGEDASKIDVDAFAYFIACGYVGTVFEWIRKGMKDDINGVLGAMFRTCRASMANAARQFAEESSK